MAATKKKEQSKPARKTLSIAVPKNLDEAVGKPSEASEEAQEDVRAVVARIEDVFKALGTDHAPDTKLPVAKNRNNAEEAAEFVLSEKLRKLAEDRYKTAKEAAAKAGIFGDDSEYVEGETVMTWNSPHYVVSMKVGKSSQMIDKGRVEATLHKYLGREKAEAALEECLKPRAGAKSIIVSLK